MMIGSFGVLVGRLKDITIKILGRGCLGVDIQLLEYVIPPAAPSLKSPLCYGVNSCSGVNPCYDVSPCYGVIC